MKNILITTSIPYVNAYPHIGFAMELIEADAIARWYRQMGDTVYFLTGTDEHGTKIFRRAGEEATTPQELVDKNADKYRELCKVLNASNDGFIRTTSAEHKAGAQAFWDKLMKNGYLEKRKFKGLYCAGCEAFVTKKDLVDGKCPNHQKAPDELEEENWFFLLSKVSDKVTELLEKGELAVIPNYRRNEILEFAKKGLNDISFSRPKNILPWGVPVPNDDSQVMYVWCDALTNYITGLGYGSSDDSNFQKFWNNGERIQLIGKDIIRFHAAFWPAMLHVAGEKIPNKLLVHGFLTSEGQKMSKSLGNVVDPFEVVDKFGTDALRFFLLSEVPFGRDADFSISRFEEIRNAYLADGLGNLLSRVHTLATRAGINPSEIESLSGDFADEMKKSRDKQVESMENFELHNAISAPFEFVAFLNKKINELEPWKLVKTEPEKVGGILRSFLESLREVNKMIDAFLPETSIKMRNALGLDDKFEWGNAFGESVILFPKEK